MTPVSPVIPDLEEFEVVIAEDQPEYSPLPALVTNDPESRVISRWRLNDEERKKVTNGADIVLTVITFGSPLQPVLLEVVRRDEAPYAGGENAQE